MTVISTLFISLDGVAEVAEDWHFPYFDEQMGAAVAEDYEGADVLVLGRITYDSFAGAWPDREAAGEDDAQFARELGDLRKIVATRGEQDLGWRNVERTADVVGTVRALRDDPAVGKVLVAGSLSVVRQLLDADLLDELRLLVHPVAARRGERLFDDAETVRPFALLRHEATPLGVLRLVYAPADLPGGGSYEEAMEHVTQA
ncbi:bifunctional deaminase-reductase domain protein [Cellulomonas flavigena DSM 20109]|uniref:Bifunctional deaminase-reductase domain protein n=1 Tax=Cellulomonas flavigena (strain ATCC 482 / DSM 20109 / BCRC 11376 / JCM 18109 / NBRC 3775 / NCIMB 8073 / NRS 134) TaxID=446466 RepID=D5UHZ9_CELFN|nr:dihydrofolate reductase family protein [Cellulomonas flavigena]ADG73423.1 bifunctional deaminase-reductase domain protein [Cellulomonas flavigena DSM 20109]